MSGRIPYVAARGNGIVARILHQCGKLSAYQRPWPDRTIGRPTGCSATAAVHVLPGVLFSLQHTATSNFVHGSVMQSLSLVMTKCSLSGRGQGHVSNFYIVDLENIATASRRYTGDIHNSTVVGLFMTPETMKATQRVSVECTSRAAR